ncbi:MAG TPA: cytochrome c [Thermodesulfobacteriota bacterium]
MVRRRSRAWVLGLVLAGGFVPALAAWAAPSPADGERLFQERCAACHTIGKGDLVGPDLQGITARRDRDWLVRWIVAPDRMLAAGDPIATASLAKYGVPMPNLGVTEAEAAALVGYLGAQAGPAPAPQPARAVALPPGDPAAGKDLFTGAARLAGGGPPCMACHSVAGIGALGGGALGPDLTPAYAKFGASGIASILATMPFPTMAPIFTTQPLTAREQADLAAFLEQTAVMQRPPQAVGALAALAGAGAVLLLALANLLWRHRLTGVRRSLVNRG